MANNGLFLVPRASLAICVGFSSPPGTIVSCRLVQTHKSRVRTCNWRFPLISEALNNPSPHGVVYRSLLLLPVLYSSCCTDSTRIYMIAVACEPSVYLGVYIIQCCTSQLARVRPIPESSYRYHYRNQSGH